MENTLFLGKIEGRKRRSNRCVDSLGVGVDRCVDNRCVDSIICTMDMSLSKLQETMKDREAWCAAAYGAQRIRHNLATEQ